jgi:hypothetical protein
MTIARLVISRHGRALLWKNQRFAGIIGPGVRWIVAPFEAVAVHLYDALVPEFEVSGVLAPGRRQLYWKGPVEVRVVKIDIRVT